MQRNKKIIISLVISLILVIAINGIFTYKSNSQYIDIPVFKTNVVKGSSISKDDITTMQVKQKLEYEELLNNVISTEEMPEYVLNRDVIRGEIVSKNVVIKKEENLENTEEYKYVAIPVSSSSNITCNKLKLGDKVVVYFTAKLKDVNRVIKDKSKIYSNNTSDGLVTCKLFENAEFISGHTSTGEEADNTVITDVLIRLDNEDAMTAINLKQLGTFDIVLD